MKFIVLVLLAGFTLVHLYHSWTDERKKRAVTKPFLLPLIAVYYMVATADVSKFNWVLLVALATSWIGDVLLIPKGLKWFTAGGISFLISHITFICVYVPNVTFSLVKWYIVAPVAVAYLAVIVWVFKTLLPHNNNKPLFAAMALYIVANASMNMFALMQLISNPCPGTIVAYIGAAFFFVSDCSLFCCDFHPNRNFVFKRHFTVMLTYVIGEFLITQGMMMI